MFSAQCDVFLFSRWSASVSFLGSSARRIQSKNTKTQWKINTVSNKVKRKESNLVAKTHLSFFISFSLYVSSALWGEGLFKAWKGHQSTDVLTGVQGPLTVGRLIREWDPWWPEAAEYGGKHHKFKICVAVVLNSKYQELWLPEWKSKNDASLKSWLNLVQITNFNKSWVSYGIGTHYER